LIVEPSTTGSYNIDVLTKYNSVQATTGNDGNIYETSNSTSTSSVWNNGASSPTPKMESAYTTAGDEIYMIAGYGETGKRNKNGVEVYDTKTDTWTSGPSMPTARHGLAAPAIGDKIYVIGGGPEPDISFANVVEVLNIGSNVVTTGTPSLP
jgi:N-acetylneuraminic acid mutarotase